MRRAKAYSPAGISSFFEVVDKEADGTPFSDPLRIGARGGGFVISRGVKTEVQIETRQKTKINVILNERHTTNARTTETVVRTMLREANTHGSVTVAHNVEPPIGCGYGTSGAGALSTALALHEALNLNMTYNQIGQVAHSAEVKHRTGLGTVGPLMVGGNVITVKPGAPGLSIIDRIPIDADYRVVTGCFAPISKETILWNKNAIPRINMYGQRALRAIMSRPTPENFLVACREFAENIGFMTDRVRRLLSLMERAGVVGATQNMLGEAAHALVEENRVRRVQAALGRILNKRQIFSTGIDLLGPGLI